MMDADGGARAGRPALAFALYRLRLHAEGISLGPVEAMVTITGKNGQLLGRLGLDARDVVDGRRHQRDAAPRLRALAQRGRRQPQPAKTDRRRSSSRSARWSSE